MSDGTTARCASQTEPGAAGKVVLRGGYHGRYVPTGHLLYVHAGTLYGVRFDLDRLETDVAARAGHRKDRRERREPEARSISIARDGTLAYVHGDSSRRRRPRSTG